MRALIAITIGLLIGACSGSDENDGGTEPNGNPPAEATPVTLAPPAEGEGFQLAMKTTVPPGTEAWICEVYPMPITDWSAVNRVEYAQTPGMHHMTLSAPGLIGGLIEPGTYECDELYKTYMNDLLMFFGNQGSGNDTLTLPEGIVANFPPSLDVIHEVHYVNVTSEPVDVVSYVNAYTIPQDDIKDTIWGGQVRDETIEIPANSEKTEWTRCIMNEDVEVLFLGAHTHKLGIDFSVRQFDGKESGDVFYQNKDWKSPMITPYNPPILLKKGTGFEYSCTWKNPTDKTINYGLTADDEMCNLAIVHTPGNASAKCEVVETSDGVLWE